MRKSKQQSQREVRRARRIQAILMHPGSADRYCAVLDISPNGAKIVAEGDAPIPARFALAFIDRGIRRMCGLIWRHNKTAGVKFV